MPTSNVVAIKQIALESSDADSEANMQDLQEIQREIASLAQCQDSERVTRYFGSFVKKYTLWVIMELMDGGSCLSLLKRGGALPDEVSAVIARELVLGLDYLHAQGIIHRDIKAANVLLTRTGQVKLGMSATVVPLFFLVLVLTADTLISRLWCSNSAYSPRITPQHTCWFAVLDGTGSDSAVDVRCTGRRLVIRHNDYGACYRATALVRVPSYASHVSHT